MPHSESRRASSPAPVSAASVVHPGGGIPAPRRYTPDVPDDLRGAFFGSVPMQRALAARERLQRASAESGRARDLLAMLDECINDATAQWPIITGPCWYLSGLNRWLNLYGAAIDGACWRESGQ